MSKRNKMSTREVVGWFVLGMSIGLITWPGCATPTPTPDPVVPPPPQLIVDCGVPSTRAQMAEVAPPLSRCVQAETPVDSCAASLQVTWTLEAIVCAARVRGMLAWRATAEGTGTPGDAVEAAALRDWLRANDFRFKY